MWTSAGRLVDLPLDRCTAIDDDRAIVVRTVAGVTAFPNRCLHQASALAGGIVKDGVLTCPLHFWRYAVETGIKIGETAALELYPTRIDNGEVWVDVPDVPAPTSLREQLLQHAREWSRE